MSRTQTRQEAAGDGTLTVTALGHRFDLEPAVLGGDVDAICRQVAEYVRGDRRTFDLPVAYPEGFTGRVMRAMAAVPYGETRTYGELAADLDTSAVAVGGACGRNPVPIVVPCHRVVAADGLGGFSAHGGVAAKRALLAHERAERPLGSFDGR